jgi:calcium/calmodulin-dependent protein kinase I
VIIGHSNISAYDEKQFMCFKKRETLSYRQRKEKKNFLFFFFFFFFFHSPKTTNKQIKNPEDVESLQKEIGLMRKLRHKHVLQLREVFEYPNEVVLVTELVPGGELFDKIVEIGAYSEGDAVNIVRQVVDGVQYLHENGVAHRDLKPENLLVGGESDEAPEIKISDFGLSKAFGAGAAARLETSCGTPDYVAPEVLRGEVYDQSVDLWSVGVITYILLCGFPPFWGESQGELFDKILAADYEFPSPEWDNVSDNAKDFIKKLLVKDNRARMTAQQCAQHAWLKSAPTGGAALNTGNKLGDYNAKRKQ